MPLDVPLPHYCRQPYPLPKDVRYVLDNMLDDQQLDEGSYIALNLFAPREPVQRVVNDHRALVIETSSDLAGPLPATCYSNRKFLAPAMQGLADAAIAELPADVAGALAYASLSWLRRDLYAIGEVFSMWVFEDETEGGAMQPFRDQRRIRPNGEVFPRTARRIRSPSYIGRYVKRATESRERRVMATRLLDRAERYPRLSNALDAFAAELAAQREAARIESIRQLRLTLPPINLLAEDIVTLNKRTTLELRKRRRRARAVIKRALGVASAVLPDPQIRAFVRGEPVRLLGRTLDLEVRLAGRLTERGHGALTVQAAATAGPALASLCVYHEATPALDQLTALALAMGAGEEAQIISDANITQMLPAGREHPLLAERETRAIVQAAGREASWTRIGRDRWSFDERRAREQSYWNETKHIWLDRLAVFACGRRAKMLGMEGQQ